jgi:hypothetical protein
MEKIARNSGTVGKGGNNFKEHLREFFGESSKKRKVIKRNKREIKKNNLRAFFWRCNEKDENNKGK